MSKFTLPALALLLFVLVVLPAPSKADWWEDDALKNKPSSAFCKVCGDPHWTTFDQVRHDFQGTGVYEHVYSKLVEVQAEHELCRPAFKVSCLRSSTAVLKTPARFFLYTTVKYGAWRVGRNVVYDSLLIDDSPVDPTTCIPPAACSLQFELGNVTYNKHRKEVTVNSYLSGAQIVIGAFYLLVKLPSNDNFLGSTVGLCGFFDGDPTDEFFANNTLYLKSKRHGRYNGPQINAWAKNFVVDGNTYQLYSRPSRYDPLTNQEIRLQSAPNASIPDDNDTAAVQQVTYDSVGNMNQIQAQCLAVNPGATADGEANINCMYDAAYMADAFELAASNHVAEMALADLNATSSASSSTLSDGTIVGISVGLGVTALLAVVVAVVLTRRVRTMHEKYQSALVVLPPDALHHNMRLSKNL